MEQLYDLVAASRLPFRLAGGFGELVVHDLNFQGQASIHWVLQILLEK